MQHRPAITNRYLIRHLLSATVFVTLALTAVIWLTQSLKLLELIASSDAPIGFFLKIVAFSLPRFLEIIFPVALVCGILFVYNKMIMDNELIVMRACGFDQFALARPVLTIAFTMLALLLLMTTWLSPRSYGEMQSLRQDIKARYSAFLLRESVFNTFGNNLTVYMRGRADNGDLLGIMIHDRRDRKHPPATVIAKRGRIVMDGDTPNILVFDGSRHQMDEATGSVTKLNFARYTIEIKGLEQDAIERWRNANERTLVELFNPDMSNRHDRMHRDIFRAEIAERLITPFNVMGYSLICLCAILLGPFNRRGQSRKVLCAALAVIALQAAHLALGNLIKKDLRFIPLMACVTFAPIAGGFFLLHPRGEAWLRKAMLRFRIWRDRKLDGVAA